MLREAEIEPARRKPETEQEAYNPTLLAFSQTFTETPERNEEVLRLLREALEIDPAHAMANALAASRLQQRHLMDWAATRPTIGRKRGAWRGWRSPAAAKHRRLWRLEDGFAPV